MSAYFKCKVCGDSHLSPIGFGSKNSFDTTTLTGNQFQCPKTGKMASYDKANMYWREEEKKK
jgi:hypothetical protein